MRRLAAAMASIVAFAAMTLLPVGVGAQIPAGSTRMVDVMGSPTRVLTIGLEDREEGQPILFLHGGAGSPLESWGEWLSDVAALAPVVAYDRPGIGGSPFDGETPTLERVAAHAHELLGALDVDPPFVLVGHSWGGPLMLYYAGQYPDEVVGMVYLDPTEPDLTPYQYLGASNEDEYASRRAEFQQAIAALNVPAGREAEQRAIVDFQGSAPGDRGLPDDPEVPTSFVLSAQELSPQSGGPAFMDEAFLEEMLSQRLGRFVARARGISHATVLVATDAGHFVHRDAPGLAEEAVRRVVDEIAEAAAAFVVSQDVLTSYVGDYELAPTFSIAVTLQDGALFIQATNQGRLPIFARTETEFFLRAVDAQISFERSADGTVTGLVLHQNGRDVPGRKVR